MTVMTRPTRALSFDPATLPGDLVIGGRAADGRGAHRRRRPLDRQALRHRRRRHGRGRPRRRRRRPRGRPGLGRHRPPRALRDPPPRLRADDRAPRRCSPSSSPSRTARRSPTPPARSPTPPSSSAGSPRRPSASTASSPSRRAGANRILVQYQPIGVAVMVTPWNFPAAMATRKIGPALAAGCTCVLKPAERDPVHRLRPRRHPRRGRRPAGVVNVVTTSQRRRRRSAPCSHDPRVRKLSFTGSTEVGRTLLKEAADQVLSCSMELGGNAPFVVFDDADLDAALDGAMIAKMRNGGEACTAANRFYVQAGIADAFSRGLSERMAAMPRRPGLRAGDQRSARWSTRTPSPASPASSTTPSAAAPRSSPAASPSTAPASTSRRRSSPASPPAPRSAARRSSARSPRSPPSPTEDEAVALANDTEYGLDRLRLHRRPRPRPARLRADRGGHGRPQPRPRLRPAAPFGGVKQSGLGREGAHHGILEFCETKYIAASW